MPDTLTVTLPFPPAPHGQNKREHRRVKAARVKANRTATKLEAESAVDGRKWEAATMKIFVFFPNRSSDILNVIEDIKADIDGVTDTKLIPDDNWTRLFPIIAPPELDKDNPRIELVFEEATRIGL